MADRPRTNPNNMEVEKRYGFGQRSPEIDHNPPILDAPQYPSSHNYSFENPQPRTLIAAETAPAAEPGFYIVPQSVSAYDFYHGHLNSPEFFAQRKELLACAASPP